MRDPSPLYQGQWDRVSFSWVKMEGLPVRPVLTHPTEADQGCPLGGQLQPFWL